MKKKLVAMLIITNISQMATNNQDRNDISNICAATNDMIQTLSGLDSETRENILQKMEEELSSPNFKPIIEHVRSKTYALANIILTLCKLDSENKEMCLQKIKEEVGPRF
uniref:Uncharacterized protein n=1 Tax=viral metagenome TaxID=1070528 RepID=A0A6C0C8T3_9ZZZZ